MTKQAWAKKRKQLPANYILKTMQTLHNKGIECAYTQIVDVIRGKNKNTLLTIQVWQGIAAVRKEHKQLLKKTKQVKNIK